MGFFGTLIQVLFGQGFNDTFHMELGLKKDTILLFITNREKQTICGDYFRAVIPGGVVCRLNSDLKPGTEFLPNEVVVCRMSRSELRKRKCLDLELMDQQGQCWLIPGLAFYAESLGWDPNGNVFKA